VIMLCPCRVDCPGTDSPFANLTSEAPDQLIFIGYDWGNELPNVGWHFTDPPNNPSWCDSPTSQEEADLCAKRTKTGCLVGDCGPGSSGPEFPWSDQNNNRIDTFFNDAAFCTVFCQDGLPFTYTVKAGTFRAFSQDGANKEAISYACNLANLNAVCFGSIANGCLNQNYLAVITVTGGFGPYTIARIGGTLPPGVGFVQDTGTTAFLSGIPTASGSYTFTLRAVDTKGNFMQKDFTVFVLAVSNASTLPTPSVGNFYNQQLLGTGGVAPYVFTNPVGLPGGLTLQTDGFVVGIPVGVIGTGFTCTMTDATGNSCSQAIAYSGCSFFKNIVWDNPPDNVQKPILHVPPNSGSATITYPAPNSVLISGNCVIVGLNADFNTSISNNGLVMTKGFTGDCKLTVTAVMTGDWVFEVFITDPTFLTTYFDTTVLTKNGNFTNTYTFTVPNIPQIAVGVVMVYGSSNVNVNSSGTFRVDFGV